jgi:DNA-directed RNA polymerase subunit H (RpoH/RPB5)
MKKSESIYTLIENGMIDVKHGEDVVTLDLPEWLTEVDGKIDNEDKLLEWAQSHDILLPLMQKGLQATVIDMRAKARPADKKKVKQVMVHEDAQKALDEYVIKPLKVPKLSKQDEMRGFMEKAGIAESEILKVLANM